MKAVIAENISSSYGKCRALEDLSIDVDDGSIFVICGPNGAGKTTLLKIIAGLKKTDTGEVYIHGQSLSKYRRKELAWKSAYVAQSGYTELPFRVEEFVLFGRSAKGGILGFESGNDIKVARQSMSLTDVSHLADKYIDCLSGGEKQRVLIARAICQETELIFLDEPTSALDLGHQIRIMELMNSLRKEKGVTVVMVSHDINLTSRYADKILLMKNGKAISCGAPHDVLTREALENVYGCGIHLGKGPYGRGVQVMPVSGSI